MPRLGQGPIRRNQIFRAVIRCIAGHGLPNLTLDAAARTAGVSKGVVNHYFKGKRDLLLQTFQAFLEDYHHRADDRIRQVRTAEEMVAVIVDLTLSADVSENDSILSGLDAEGLGRVWLAFLAQAQIDPGFIEVLREVYGQYLFGTTAVIGYGQETGEFGPGDARAAAAGLMALLDGMLLHRILGLELWAPGGDRDQALEYIHRMLPPAGGDNGGES